MAWKKLRRNPEKTLRALTSLTIFQLKPSFITFPSMYVGTGFSNK